MHNDQYLIAIGLE